MSQVERGTQLIDRLLSKGLGEFVICPGARNAPLVSGLTKSSTLRHYSFFEERSAGFFALGRIQASGRPVAVVTTSGTAAVELAPAMTEAYYLGLPLVAITADRPKSYRGTGAPQSIDQRGIFSVHQKGSFDFEMDRPPSWNDLENFLSEGWPRGPIHLNLCFDEPLIDGEQVPRATLGEVRWAGEKFETKEFLLEGLKAFKRPLVIVAGLRDSKPVEEILTPWEGPVLAECHSQLAHRPNNLRMSDVEVRALVDGGHIDSVIRLGGVPTHRIWRDLDSKFRHVPVLSLAEPPFTGLSRKSEMHLLNKENLSCVFSNLKFQGDWPLIRDMNQEAELRRNGELEARPLSERAWVRRLSSVIPEGAAVLVGNSLAIREWDLYAVHKSGRRIYSNRGTNGIDGLVSTGLGVAVDHGETWILVGDLSALYDLASLWALRHLENPKVRVVVMNNGGGKIFTKMFGNPAFENPHNLNFSAWAALFSVPYELWTLPSDVLSPLPQSPCVIEIRPQHENLP